jgi:hypothetical protein
MRRTNSETMTTLFIAHHGADLVAAQEQVVLAHGALRSAWSKESSGSLAGWGSSAGRAPL